MAPDRVGRRAVLGRVVSVLSLGGLAGCLGHAPASPTASPSATTRSTGHGSPTIRPGGTSRSPGSTTTAIHPGYDTTTVEVTSPSGAVLGTLTAAIADTPTRRYRGLSDTASLPADRGMLFVFEAVAERTFVMRGMAFGIDIVYADADGRITRIHHAQAPGPDEDGSEQRYPGRGKYVLETVRGWTTTRGIRPGDRLRFDLPGSPPASVAAPPANRSD